MNLCSQDSSHIFNTHFQFKLPPDYFMDGNKPFVGFNLLLPRFLLLLPLGKALLGPLQ